jgi:putative ABC transport system substrate-binding protein
MKRRKFIAFLGSAAAASPLAALAQRANQTQRIGVLMGLAENDPEGQERYAALRERLQKLGWTEGGNIRVITRWAAGDIARTQAYAAELVSLAPDVILVNTPPGLAALQTATRSIPVVFVQVVDAAESAANSPARPGGNITGFYTFFEYSMTGKWLEMLKEIAPRVRRVAAMQNPKHPAWARYLSAISSVAPSLGIEVIPAPVQEPAEIERVIARFARVPDGALIVLPDTFTTAHRGLIVAAAARYSVPAIGQSKAFAAAGGLMSYGADLVDLLRQSGTYVDRILRGAKPTELPVQASTKFELVINLRTAKALGLTIPQSILLRADNVIE